MGLFGRSRSSAGERTDSTRKPTMSHGTHSSPRARASQQSGAMSRANIRDGPATSPARTQRDQQDVLQISNAHRVSGVPAIANGQAQRNSAGWTNGTNPADYRTPKNSSWVMDGEDKDGNWRAQILHGYVPPPPPVGAPASSPLFMDNLPQQKHLLHQPQQTSLAPIKASPSIHEGRWYVRAGSGFHSANERFARSYCCNFPRNRPASFRRRRREVSNYTSRLTADARNT